MKKFSNSENLKVLIAIGIFIGFLLLLFFGTAWFGKEVISLLNGFQTSSQDTSPLAK